MRLGFSSPTYHNEGITIIKNDNKPPFDGEETDEELVEKIELEEDANAYNELARRYFKMRFFLAKYYGSDTNHYLDEWDINGAFFHAFLRATKTYDSKRHTSFLTYFRHVYENEVIATYRAKQRSIPSGVISLDEEMYGGDDGDAFTLCEMVPSNSAMDDPVAFMRYMDVLRITKKLPQDVPEDALNIVRLKTKGYSLRAAAKELCLKYSYARRVLQQFRNYAMRTLRSVYDLDDETLRQKEERFERYIIGEGESDKES